MAECLPWLQQGDVFASIPYFVAYVDDHGDRLVVPPGPGPAVLITENCQLDKRTGSGRVRPNQRLQFVPVQDIRDLGADREARLLNREINPPEAVYVMPYEDTHLVGMLGNLFSLPAEYFRVETIDFTEHPEADAKDPHHLVAPGWDRIATMEPQDIDVMYQKIYVYWTGAERALVLPPDDGPISLPGI